MAREMHLTLLLLGAGMHEAAWRHPTLDPSVVWDARHYLAAAQLAEQAKFDAVFLTDELSSPAGQGGDDAAGRLEPISLLSYMAGGTERIGLVATASTTFTEPYNLARKFATLDHISNGRAGWNIVTTASNPAAQNFGYEDILDHDLRYERAAEYVDLVRRLWDSWDDGAVLADRSRANHADLTKINAIDFVGRFYQSRGPLNIPRGPQRYPVLFQAGTSPAGIDLAAGCADAIFTVQQSMESGRAFAAQVRAAAIRHDRDPGSLLVLPGIVPYLGSTEAEATRFKQELDDLADPDRGLADLSIMLGLDLTDSAIDGPVPNLEGGSKRDGRANVLREIGRRDGMTLRQLIRQTGGSRGHQILVGTPDKIADHCQAWFEAGAADGFTVAPPVVPYGLSLFAEYVVPILQERGLFRTEYTGRTLRAHLGLERPTGVLPTRSGALAH
jgi:FMN-dependent oxidoreductase (nitrilotriacetate monooxygenase family)